MFGLHPGLVGMIVIYLSIIIPTPLLVIIANQDHVTASQTCAGRGLLALICLIPFAWRNVIRPPSAALVGMAITIGLAAVSLSQATIVWGPNLTFSVASATPVASFAIALLCHRQVQTGEYLCLALAMGGVLIVLQPWHDITRINPTGLGLSIFGTITSALFLELLKKTGITESSSRQTIWQAIGVASVGLCFSATADWTIIYATVPVATKFLVIAILMGPVNFWANGVAMNHIPTTTFSIAVVGITPVTIIVSGLVLGQYLTPFQWFGVITTCLGLLMLTRTPKSRVTSEPTLPYAAESYS